MRPRLALLTLLAAVSLVVAGCGGASAPERALMSLSSSAKKTSAATTYRMETRISISIPGVADGLELTATGAVDTAAKLQTMKIDMSKLLGALGGAGGAAAPRAADLEVEMVMKGLTMYMRMPFLTSQLPSGKSWVSMDVAKIAQANGADLSSLLGQSYADPSQYLDYLTAATGELEELGNEEVRGVDTRHVRTSVDLEAYLDRLDPALKQRIGPLVERFEQTVGSVRPVVEVWVDGEGLVRRMALDMGFALPGAAGGSGAMDMQMTIDLFDFGTDVAIELPPASEVVDGTSLGLGG